MVLWSHVIECSKAKKMRVNYYGVRYTEHMEAPFIFVVGKGIGNCHESDSGRLCWVLVGRINARCQGENADVINRSAALESAMKQGSKFVKLNVWRKLTDTKNSVTFLGHLSHVFVCPTLDETESALLGTGSMQRGNCDT